MKSILTMFMLVCVLIGIVAGSAWGATAYVDQLADGSWKLDDNAHQDASGTIIGLEFPVKQYKFGVEFLKASLDTPSNNDIDITGYEVKAGYRIFKTPSTNVVAWSRTQQAAISH